MLTPPSRKVAARLQTGVKILIIDDYAELRAIVRTMLHQIGCYDVTDDDGRNALRKLREGNFDLVLCDLYIDGINGLDLLRQIRADAKLAAIPFIMITAAATSENVLAARALGVEGFLVKPFYTDMLIRQIYDALEREMTAKTVAATEEAPEIDFYEGAILDLMAKLEQRVSSHDLTLREDMIAQLQSLLDRAVSLGLNPTCRARAEALCAAARHTPSLIHRARTDFSPATEESYGDLRSLGDTKPRDRSAAL